MSRDAADALKIKHTLSRNARPRVEGLMFNAEFGRQLRNAAARSNGSLENVDHGK
jgi:hypothetical protein